MTGPRELMVMPTPCIDGDAVWRHLLIKRDQLDPVGRVSASIDSIAMQSKTHYASCTATGLTIQPDGRWAWNPIHGEPCDDAVRRLDLYAPLLARRSCVIGQLGQSIDGAIATVSGQSHYVTGVANRNHLHRLRALSDAVVVGGATVAHDDPRLTVRHVAGDNPVRVVLDPNGRLQAEHRVFQDGAAPTLHVVRDGHVDGEAKGSVGNHVDRLVLTDLEPGGLLAALAARGLRRVLVEGGGVTVSRFLAARQLDRLHVCIAPMIVGGGRPGLVPKITLPPINRLDQAMRPAARWFAMGDDMLCDLDLRAPAARPEATA